MPDGAEIELKFEVEPGAVTRLEQKLLVLPGAKAAPPPQRLTSVYYDTPGFELMKAGLTLRIRESGGKHVQTVKAEAEGLSVRGEWETQLDSPGLDIKAIARTPLEAVLKGLKGELRPMFVTRIERTRRLVRQGKARIEAALDRGEIEAEGRTAPVCELELELKLGDPAALYALARRLAAAAPLRLSFVSKAERGYRLLEGHTVGEAIKQAKVKLKRGMSARQAFQLIAAACLRQWAGNAAVLRAARRPEALHQMRVALRRLRTALKLFEPVVADADYPRLVGELQWLAAELDQGRDIDVLIAETFRPAAARFHDQTGMAGLGERLLKARTKAYDRMLGVLDQPRYLVLVLDMAAWIETGHWADPADPVQGPQGDAPVERLAREGLDKLRRQIKRRGRRLKTLDPERRHKLRIRAKRLRYALEFFGDLYEGRNGEGRNGRGREEMLGALKALQDGLGLLNDMKVARDKGLAMAEGGGRAAGDSEAEGVQEAYAAGLMIGLRLKDSAALIEQARKDWSDLMDAKSFWR
jgi:inorganic triphosphatase YgiF